MNIKYAFEVTTHEDENIIKLEITSNGFSGISSNIVRSQAGVCYYEHCFDELCKNVLDNMRLTVKEREDAEYNLFVFKNYVTQVMKPKQQLIVENNDASEAKIKNI